MEASVIIPTYNSPEVIRCLKALERNRNDFEVIIVDDGSMDDTVGRIRKFSKKSKLDIKIYEQAHRGPASARNFGASKAKEEILLFTDADCFPDKRWIKEMINPLSDPKVVGVGGTYRVLNEESLIARFVGYEIALRHEMMPKEIDFIGTYSAAYRREVFMKEEGFDTKFKAPSGEDPEFSFRLAEKGYKMVFNPNAIVYHEHPSSIVGYLGQKFNRGYWRVRLYRKHPRKIAGESYTPLRVLVQIPLSILLFLGLFLVPFIGFALFTISLAFLLSINLIEGIKMYKFERKMVILAPIILSLRSIFSTLGVILGLINRLYSLQ